mmetsp:Transcript_130287/g.353553  ORF Transcript_130287/g.353553 Transcript_130287/m.353553 type:complete len:274 (-) Transcript_130287:6-827(-)
MFLDLSVCWDAARAPASVDLALRFEYAGIAHNVTLSGAQVLSVQAHKCPVAPCRLPGQSERGGPLRGSLAAELGMGAEHGTLLQLRRLTLVVSDAAQLQAVSRAAQLRPPYDLLAVRPLTEESFQLACERGECDLISLRLDERLPFPLRRATVASFLSRGGFFEIEFAPALRDPGRRRQLIAGAEQLLHATRGKNIIITSGARDPMEMRSPHDLANFAAVLGLRGELALRSVADAPRRALQRAALRRGWAQPAPGPEPGALGGEPADAEMADV